MSKFNIKSIVGHTNIIGDNNTIKNSMSREDFFRDEASSFIDYNVESNSFLSDGHKRFLDALRVALSDYYSVEDKMLFLHFTRMKLNEYIEQTRNESSEVDTDPFDKMLFFLNQEINELPRIVTGNFINAGQERTTVFICYCRTDRKQLDDLKRHFTSLGNRVIFWEDSLVEGGKKWKEEILKAIDAAKVGILLISADFFNSDFIQTQELPLLLAKANSEGLTILNVFLKPSMYEEYPQIMQYQGINNPLRPASSLDENNREELWVELVRQVKKIIV